MYGVLTRDGEVLDVMGRVWLEIGLDVQRIQQLHLQGTVGGVINALIADKRMKLKPEHMRYLSDELIHIILPPELVVIRRNTAKTKILIGASRLSKTGGKLGTQRGACCCG